jgi:uncharacterized membrane protein YozB (DUF420 family)
MNANGWAAFLRGAGGRDVGDAAVVAAVHPLIHLNAALNLLATGLLCVALWQIRRRREAAHGRTMLAALAVSGAFLTSYLIYHFGVRLTVRFTHPGPVRYVYYTILVSHVLLAFSVPALAISAAFMGVKSLGWASAAALTSRERARFRAKHLRIVRWAFPIWLYVSITGVVVYAMLYLIWPSTDL